MIDDETEPVLCPKQGTGKGVRLTVKPEGCVTVKLDETEQVPASVTVTV